MPMTTCLDCGVEIPKRFYRRNARCTPCTDARDRGYNRASQRAAYKDPVYMSYSRTGFCVVCGAVDDLTIDHIIPLIRGGTNDPRNLRLLCRSCNSSRVK